MIYLFHWKEYHITNKFITNLRNEKQIRIVNKYFYYLKKYINNVKKIKFFDNYRLRILLVSSFKSMKQFKIISKRKRIFQVKFLIF